MLYLANPTGRTISENSPIKKQHETTKLLNEKGRMLQGTLIAFIMK